MSQIQFFYDDEIVTLQGNINAWLRENKDVNIIETNLNSLGKPGTATAGVPSTEKYIFYILYEGRTMMATMDKQEAQEAMVAPAVQATDITNLSN